MKIELHPSWKYRLAVSLALGALILPFAAGFERLGWFNLGLSAGVLSARAWALCAKIGEGIIAVVDEIHIPGH